MIDASCALLVKCLLLNFLMLHITHGFSACEPGWFGTNCQYKCLCTGSRCDSTGQCMAGSKCKPGYFGPACQYGDIVQLTSLTSDAPMWLKDGDDATCSSDPSLHSLTLRFHQGLSFSWLRISVSSSDALTRFDIKLNNDASCLNMKTARVDDTSIDVYCSAAMAVTSLTLAGPGVQFLCSVYISLGRNVASRAPTRQPSINLHGKLGTTLLAPGSYHMCSQTVKIQSSWNHTFRTPQSVTALFWTKRNGERSSGISVKMFGADGQLVNDFVSGKEDFYIPIQRPQPVSMMSISAHSNELLNLCELFIFGETVCPDGMFGLDCESVCNCTDRRKTCLISTGQCTAACSDGFYGWNCSAPCPNACRSGICTPRHGDCITESVHADVQKRAALGCKAGFYGLRCTKPCDAKCDHGACDTVTGACLKCPQGQYGNNCSDKCDTRCVNELCDADTGTCLDCAVGKWGNFCQEVCGDQCYHKECNATTGKCISCAAGFKGPDCVKVPWNVTLFIVLLFLIPSVIACFFCCEVLSDEDAEGQSDNFDPERDLVTPESSDRPSTSAL